MKKTYCSYIILLIILACAGLSCDSDSDSETRIQRWGVFRTWNGDCIAGTANGSECSLCNQGCRSTASEVEPELWVFEIIGKNLQVVDVPANKTIASGVIDGAEFELRSADGDWAFSALISSSGCCFDSLSSFFGDHWHGIRMPDYNNPADIGMAACDQDYTNWYSDWTAKLFANSKVIETSAGSIEYALIGDSGPVIGFMHGGPGSYYSAIAYFDYLLNQGFRFLTWSRPGFSRTPLSTGLTPQSQADAFAALLDALGLDKVAIIGASAGGPPMYYFAIRHPERTWAVLAVDAVSQAYNPASGQKLGEKTWVYLLGIESGMWLYNSMFEYADLGTARQFIGMMSRLSDTKNDELAAYVVSDPYKHKMLENILLSMSPNKLLISGTFNDLEHYAKMEPLPLERISAPTLIIHGTADGDVPPEDAELAASMINGSELYWVQDGVHVVTLLPSSNATTAKMIDFLKTNQPQQN